jgi:hypothetical protein
MSGCILLGCIKLLLHFTLADNNAAQQGETQPPAELIRCLVLYGQRMLIVASLNLDWPATMDYPLRVLALVWSAYPSSTHLAPMFWPHSSRNPVHTQLQI